MSEHEPEREAEWSESYLQILNEGHRRLDAWLEAHQAQDMPTDGPGSPLTASEGRDKGKGAGIEDRPANGHTAAREGK